MEQINLFAAWVGILLGFIAGAVLFLLSGEASYITGHCLNVNGGLHFG